MADVVKELIARCDEEPQAIPVGNHRKASAGRIGARSIAAAWDGSLAGSPVARHGGHPCSERRGR